MVDVARAGDVIIGGGPKDTGGVGDEGNPDEGDKSGKEVAAAKDLTEEDGAGPCGDDGDEEAEDGCFGEGKIVHGVYLLSVSQPSNIPNPGQVMW